MTMPRPRRLSQPNAQRVKADTGRCWTMIPLLGRPHTSSSGLPRVSLRKKKATITDKAVKKIGYHRLA
jgi:hypothetical protein